jgi:hypothetical protein
MPGMGEGLECEKKRIAMEHDGREGNDGMSFQLLCGKYLQKYIYNIKLT